MQKQKNPTVHLKNAVEILDAFNLQLDTPPSGGLQKTVGLMREFFNGSLSQTRKKNNRKKTQDSHDLLRAIDVIKSHYFLIERLQQGTLPQQKLAASALAAISRFNALIENARRTPSSLTTRITDFFEQQSELLALKNLSAITLPNQAKVQLDYHEKEAEGELYIKKFSPHVVSPYTTASLKKISMLSKKVAPLAPLPVHVLPYLNRQALDLFYMKIIALVEKNKLLSNSEARHALRRATFQTLLEEEADVCTANCTLNPFPGHSIYIKGSFQKDPQSTVYAIPLPQSFHLTFTSTQTGFPHPSQYAGWALSDLLPMYPHQPEQLPMLMPLYAKKQAIAKDLLPHGSMLEKAKQLMRYKKEIFQKYSEHFLQLHATLNQFMAKAAPLGAISEGFDDIIADFYRLLQQTQNIYDYLADTHHLIIETFVMRPYEKLQAAWADNLPMDSLHAAEHLLNDEVVNADKELLQQREQMVSDLEKSTVDFIRCMGKISAAPSHKIMLQYLSETMDFPAPILNDFELKYQSCAIKQLQSFLTELEEDEIGDQEKLLNKYLESDIILFKAESLQKASSFIPEVHIALELDAYYRGPSRIQR